MKPIEFMNAFMKSLVDLGSDTDKYEKTIQALTPYANSQAIITAIHTDINASSSPTEFLLNKCGIDLDNTDVGGLLGYDASGNTPISALDVLNESGISLVAPPSTSVVINNFNITFPSMSSLTPQGQFIVKGLYSWWYPLAFDVIKTGYGLSITDSSYVKTMDTDLFNAAPSGGAIELAYVATSFNMTSGLPTKLSCRINVNPSAYGNIDTTNENGYAPVLGTSYLDRTLLHELTHALMSANIQGFANMLPTYFKEGTAELLNGCDDTRKSGILSAISNPLLFDDGISETPTSALDWYTSGYIYLRYLLKQVATYIPIITDNYKFPAMEIYEDSTSAGIRFEHGITRYGNFKSIFLEYMDFIQRTSDTIPAWELCTGSNFDDFHGATFRIPMGDAIEVVSNDIATIVVEHTPASGIVNAGYTTDVALASPTDTSFSAIGIYGGCWYTNEDFEQFLTALEANIVNGIHCLQLFMGMGKNISTLSHGYGTLSIETAWNRLINIIDTYELQTDITYVGGTHSVNYIYQTVITDSQYQADIKNNSFFNGYTSIYNSLRSNDNITLHDIGNSMLLQYPTVASLRSVMCVADNGNNPPDVYFNLDYKSFVSNILHEFTTIPQSVKISRKTSLKSPCYYLSLNYNKDFDYNAYISNYLTNIKDPADIPDKIINSGEFIPFTLHTLYDSNLYACEQGGASGKPLFDYNKYMISYPEYSMDYIRTEANLINKYSLGVFPQITPVIPGTGTPWFTYSATDKIKYPTIEFYFTKTAYNSSIVLNFYNSEDDSITPIWNDISFGIMNTDEESYKFPLFICGGTTALKPTQTTHYYYPNSRPTWIYGNSYDLDIRQINLSSSNLLYPTRLKNTGITNSMLLGSDGVWKYIYNYTQGINRLVQPESLAGLYPVPKYCIIPTSITTNDTGKSVVYPTISDTHGIGNMYNSTGVFNNEMVPVSLLADKTDLMEELGIAGNIPNHYAVKDIGNYGLSTKNSVRYLIMPNGWKSRIPYYNSLTFDGSTDIAGAIDDYLADIEAHSFNQSLVIKVGELS